MPFADDTKAVYVITTEDPVFNHVPYFYVVFSLMTCNSKKNRFYYQLWNESLTELWAQRAPGVSNRGCLCCQSKAEQWLRLISILMNANWHICYGGLAVQTLQLAWLINYPPAGGSLEMEAGGTDGGWRRCRKRDERAYEEKTKWAENCPKPSLNKSASLFD